MKEEDTCIRPDCTENFNANTAWVAQKLDELLQVDPNISYELMLSELKKNREQRWKCGSCIGKGVRLGWLVKGVMRILINN